MKFCQEHWDALRAAIEQRGIGNLIAPDGETAAAQMVDQLQRAEVLTPANYDPLMAAHWAIVNNIAQTAHDALYIMVGGCCPLCCANEQHAEFCKEPDCKFSYDDWIERAADDQLEHVKALRAEAKPALPHRFVIDEDPSA